MKRLKNMMTPVKIASVAAVAALVSAPAFAGGMAPVVAEPVAAPVAVVPAAPAGADWTGFYAGGSLGYGQGEASDIDADGLTYGVHGGYLYDMGSLVLGGEVDYTALDITDDATGQNYDAALIGKVRAGYDMGNFLPYVTAGVSQLDISGASEGTDTGSVYGLGADYQLNDSWRLGAEVLKHDYSDFDSSGTDRDLTTAAVRASFQF